MAALDTGSKIGRVRPQNDIYTALLGLTFLALAAVTTFVCLRSMDFFGTFFKMGG